MSNQKSENRIRNNKIRRQKEIRKNILATIMTIGIIIILSLSASSFMSKAKCNDDNVDYKYYKCIAISSNDTLWSIAQEYMDIDHYRSIDDYIKEVKQMNHLKTDVITYGGYLIIPYYSTAYIG